MTEYINKNDYINDKYNPRVIRGGSWDYTDYEARALDRNGIVALASRGDDIGFRLVAVSLVPQLRSLNY